MYQCLTSRHLLTNSSNGMKKSRLKQLFKKSLQIASITFGVSLLTFGGYLLGLIFFFLPTSNVY